MNVRRHAIRTNYKMDSSRYKNEMTVAKTLERGNTKRTESKIHYRKSTDREG